MAIPHKRLTKKPVECGGCLAQTTEPYRQGWHVDRNGDHMCRPCTLIVGGSLNILLPIEQASARELEYATSNRLDLRSTFRHLRQIERRRRTGRR